ncbi:MAG: VWA domain-containing protein [Clostridia bacterium]|nr:VWA domain-containing protein [Clostridia bacterium]
MTSISFDNPFLLILSVPALLLLLIPYFIAMRKENKSKSTRISLCIHVVIVVLVSLVIAGLHVTTVMTKTEVIFVADLSYSTDGDIEKIDGYIKDAIKEENIPVNTKVGVVCFGKNSVLNTELGGKFESVTKTMPDVSATDVSSALEYASNLFSSDAIKKIILITDGNQNTSGGSTGMINSVKNMAAKDIYIDAVYIDSNLKDGEKEVQITEIDYVKSVFKDTEARLEVLIRSNTEYIPDTNNQKDKNDSFVCLYDSEGNLVKKLSAPLKKGMNIVTFNLDTKLENGEKRKTTDYRVTVEANHDTSPNNNEFIFTQEVIGEYRVLLVSKRKGDYEKAKEIYGENAVIDKPLIDNKDLPYMLEELCQYDVFIMSNIDINGENNGSAFVTNMNTAVSSFGKTLIMAGNMYVQNKTESIYKTLGGMAAMSYGNSSLDPNLYAIVIDSSRSMQDASQLIMAKKAAIQLLELMKPGDEVMVLSVSGNVSFVHEATDAVKNKEAVIEAINNIKPTQGTVLGAGLRLAYEQIAFREGFSKKQVLLISDGRSYMSAGEKEDPLNDPLKNAKALFDKGVFISTINTNSQQGVDLLKQIARIGQGGEENTGYFFIETPEHVVSTVTTDVADILFESVIMKDTPVKIKDYSDPLVRGLSSVPNIGGYYFGKERADATVVLEAYYEVKKGVEIPVPIYSYKRYKEGLVITLATDFSGDWVSNWSSDPNGIAVFTRMLTENIPQERKSYPFDFEIEYDGSNAKIEIIPGEPNPDITVDMEILSPSGIPTSYTISYNDGSYAVNYEINEAGKYYANIAYTYGEKIFPASIGFDVSYLPEYNSFEFFDPGDLRNAVGDSGTVIEDGASVEGEKIKLSVDQEDMKEKTVYFIIPLMASAVILFVIDIIIRKLKWSDIKSFFGKKQAGGEAK